MKYTCPYCGTEFDTSKPNRKTCGNPSCQKAHAMYRYKQLREEEDKLYYDDKTDSEKLFYSTKKEDLIKCLNHIDFIESIMQSERDITFSEAKAMIQSAISLHCDFLDNSSCALFSKEVEGKITWYVRDLIFDMFPCIMERQRGGFYVGRNRVMNDAWFDLSDKDEIQNIYGTEDNPKNPKYIKPHDYLICCNPLFALHIAPHKNGRYLLRKGTNEKLNYCSHKQCKWRIDDRFWSMCSLKTELLNRESKHSCYHSNLPKGYNHNELTTLQIIDEIHKCSCHYEEIKTDRALSTLTDWFERNFWRFEIDNYTKKCVYEIIEHQERKKRWRDSKLMSKVKSTTDLYIKNKFIEENKIFMAAYRKYTEEV